MARGKSDHADNGRLSVANAEAARDGAIICASALLGLAGCSRWQNPSGKYLELIRVELCALFDGYARGADPYRWTAEAFVSPSAVSLCGTAGASYHDVVYELAARVLAAVANTADDEPLREVSPDRRTAEHYARLVSAKSWPWVGVALEFLRTPDLAGPLDAHLRREAAGAVRYLRTLDSRGNSADSADSKTDSRKKSAAPVPENSEVPKLARKIKREQQAGITKIDSAREFTNQNEQRAQSLLRQLRRFPRLLE